jgi:16S rRNA (guanine527-N7)-methyltransferase
MDPMSGDKARWMKIGSDNWGDLLIRGAQQLRVDMDHDQAVQFGRYAHILKKWNRKINLTSITDSRDIAVKHFLDSVAPSALIPQQGTLLDIGTGGGFPGVPLKILRPQQAMVLIDGVRKKINFVKYVLRELHLDNIEAIQVRAEDLIRHHYKTNQFDIIVSRALADVDVLLELAEPLLRPGGRLVVYKGAQTVASNIKINGLYYNGIRFDCSDLTYRLPFTGHQRTVLIILKPM